MIAHHALVNEDRRPCRGSCLSLIVQAVLMQYCRRASSRQLAGGGGGGPPGHFSLLACQEDGDAHFV